VREGSQAEGTGEWRWSGEMEVDEMVPSSTASPFPRAQRVYLSA
jgi:hypothetical protein